MSGAPRRPARPATDASRRPARRATDAPRRPARPATDAPRRPAPGEPRIRLFVALELADAARAALAAFRDRADPGVWRRLPDGALHVTLAFLGPRPPADVEACRRALRAAPGAAPRLRLGEARGLPPRRPRVLCAAVADPDGVLAALQAALSEDLAAAGVYVPEARPFLPHVTVARLRPSARPGDLPSGPEQVAFTAPAVTLFESRLHPHGARYEPLVRRLLVPA